jgi:hypothetical protein
MMNKKLERIELLEKKLKAQKRKELAKEYEKLGRKFYKKAQAKSIDMADNMLTNMPLTSQTSTLTEERLTNLQTQEKQLLNLKSQLQVIANGLEWTGNYWHAENLNEVTQWLSQFRKENEQ